MVCGGRIGLSAGQNALSVLLHSCSFVHAIEESIPIKAHNSQHRFASAPLTRAPTGPSLQLASSRVVRRATGSHPHNAHDNRSGRAQSSKEKQNNSTGTFSPNVKIAVEAGAA